MAPKKGTQKKGTGARKSTAARKPAQSTPATPAPAAAEAVAPEPEEAQDPAQSETVDEVEGIKGAPTEITDANDVELSQPRERAPHEVDVRRPDARQAAAKLATDAAVARGDEGEGPHLNTPNKIAPPAPAHEPMAEVDPNRHVPRTSAAMPPAPTRFDGSDSEGVSGAGNS